MSDTPISLTQLEQAINYWRTRSPSVGEALRLCPEAAALAPMYAHMIVAHRRELMRHELDEAAGQAFDAWRAAVTP